MLCYLISTLITNNAGVGFTPYINLGKGDALVRSTVCLPPPWSEKEEKHVWKTPPQVFTHQVQPNTHPQVQSREDKFPNPDSGQVLTCCRTTASNLLGQIF